MTSFAGKTVLVTGASGGIGEALAHVLAAKDARVVLLARREAELERVRSALPDPDRHVAVARDLEGADLSQLVDGIAQNVAPIDVLINNAGMSQWALAEDTSLETDRRIMEVNYFAAVALTKAVLPSMLARGSGHIVAVSSVMGKIGTPRRSAYAASKH
jgi:short-subunit dehydrogenase